MKTAMETMLTYIEAVETEEFNQDLEYIKENCIQLIKKEKQQHEKTSIAITNVFMDALDNPKGGKFNGEDEFNEYWDKTYNV